MNLRTRLRGRPQNRWQDEVREDGRIVGREGWQEKLTERNGRSSSERQGIVAFCTCQWNERVAIPCFVRTWRCTTFVNASSIMWDRMCTQWCSKCNNMDLKIHFLPNTVTFSYFCTAALWNNTRCWICSTNGTTLCVRFIVAIAKIAYYFTTIPQNNKKYKAALMNRIWNNLRTLIPYNK
jgi:hypothetical protein